MSDPADADEELVLSETTETLAELVGSPCDAGRIIRPGDVLIVSTEDAHGADVANAVEHQLRSTFPDLAGVVVMSRIRFEAVYRPDPVDEEATP